MLLCEDISGFAITLNVYVFNLGRSRDRFWESIIIIPLFNYLIDRLIEHVWDMLVWYVCRGCRYEFGWDVYIWIGGDSSGFMLEGVLVGYLCCART